MGPKRYGPEQIVRLLREAEVLLSPGRTVPAMCRELEFGEQRHNEWQRSSLNPGLQQVTWDSSLGSGRRVGSGVYFYRLTMAGLSDTKKMVLLR